MYVKIEISDVTHAQLPDVIHCFTPVHVESMSGGGFRVTTLPQGGPESRLDEQAAHWLLTQFSEFDRIFNEPTHTMRAIVTRKQQGRDCTEDESAAIKRYFDTHDPGHHATAARLAEEFPVEHGEWHADFDASQRPAGSRAHTEG